MPAAFAYTYDANGAVRTRTEGATTYTHGYDVPGRQASVAVAGGATSTFVYNGDGVLVARQVAGRTVGHYAAGGLYEVDPATNTTRKYALFGGRRVAVTTTSGPPPQTTTTVQYLHQDHLGSTGLVTTASGAFAQARFQAPFGAPWYTPTTTAVAPTLGTRFGEPWPAADTQQAIAEATDRHYTGQRSFEASLGSLYHYQARWYSPVLGRFLSPDPIVPEPGNPQSLNRYSYVYNNPFRYIDPSGYARVEGYYRPDGSTSIWKGWYESEEDETFWRPIHRVATGVGRDIAEGIHVTCSTAGTQCSAWRQQYYTGIGGSSWLMHPVPGQKICIGCEGVQFPVPEGVDPIENIQTVLGLVNTAGHPVGIAIWTWLVWPEHPLDHARENQRQFEPYGNFEYGATGSALRLPEEVLVRAGGIVGMRRAAPGEGKPWDIPGWRSCYGDQCADTLHIRAGVSFFRAALRLGLVQRGPVYAPYVRMIFRSNPF